jgi:hypothetical protein
MMTTSSLANQKWLQAFDLLVEELRKISLSISAKKSQVYSAGGITNDEETMTVGNSSK